MLRSCQSWVSCAFGGIYIEDLRPLVRHHRTKLHPNYTYDPTSSLKSPCVSYSFSPHRWRNHRRPSQRPCRSRTGSKSEIPSSSRICHLLLQGSYSGSVLLRLVLSGHRMQSCPSNIVRHAVSGCMESSANVCSLCAHNLYTSKVRRMIRPCVAGGIDVRPRGGSLTLDRQLIIVRSENARVWYENGPDLKMARHCYWLRSPKWK